MLKNFLVEIIDAPLDGVVRSYIPEKHFIGKKMLVSYSCDPGLCYISMLGKYYGEYIDRRFIKKIGETPENNGDFYHCWWCGQVCLSCGYNIKNETIIFNYCPKCLR